MEKKFLSTTPKDLVSKSSSDGDSRSPTRAKLLQTVEPKYIGLVMKLAWEISRWKVAEVSELRKDCK